MSYICSVNYHIHFEEHARMDCSMLEGHGIVLNIGDATLWPSREQLVAIRDAIDGYLDTHPDPVEEQAMNAEIAADIAADDRAEALAQFGPEVAAGTLTEARAIELVDDGEPWF